jgi:hypothetical protein
VGKTENAVGASTKAKKISPPIQQTSDSSMRNRRKDIAENYMLRIQTGNWQATTENCLHRHRHILHNLFHHLIGLLGFLQRRGVATVDNHAVREYRHSQRLEILWSAETATI